jgi:hypothetical protein
MGDLASTVCWWLEQAVAWVLEPAEREAVLGDVAESDRPRWRDLAGIAGLVARRQFKLWRTAQAWLGVLGLLVPLAELLFGLVLASAARPINTLLTQGVLPEDATTRADQLASLACAILLSIGWAAVAGLMQGIVFRRAGWLYAALYCLIWLRPDYWHIRLPPFDWFAVLVPFLAGVWWGVRMRGPGFQTLRWLAGTMAVLTLLRQVEQSRQVAAMLFWASGVNWNGSFTFVFHVIPFLAILLQFGLLTVGLIGKKETHA